MPDPTTNFAWDVPTIGGDNNAWGTLLNAVFDDIDTDLQAVKDTADAAKAVTDALDADGVLDAVAGKKLYLSYAAFTTAQDEDDTTWGVSGEYLLTDNTGNPDVFCPIVLPQGATITQVDLICDKNSNTSVTARLNKVSASTGSKTEVGTGSRSDTGVGAASITGLSETVGASFYTLEAEFTGLGVAGIKIYGVVVTYTSHDLSEVL